MPEELFKNIKNNLKKEWIITFVFTFLCGLIVHMYKFTNFLPNWDSLMDYYYPMNNMTHQGRQFQVLSCSISGFDDAPWIIGILCLLYLSVTVVLLTDLFEITNPFSMLLFSIVMVSFPTFTSCFAFMYMADAFFISLLFSVLSVFLTLRIKHGGIIGAILLSLSLGTYQAYLSFAIALILIWTIFEILFKHLSFKRLLPIYGKLLLMGIGAIIIYTCSLQILSTLERIPLSGHQGMGSISLPDLQRIITGIVSSYIDTIYFFIGSIRNLNIYGICNMIIIISTLVLLIYQVIIMRHHIKPLNFMIIVLSLLLFPMIGHIFYFISPDVKYHTLMQAALVLIYLLAIIAYNNVRFPSKWVYWSMFCTIVLLSYSNIITANNNYTALTRSYQKSYAIMNRIADRMEQLDNFSEADTIAVIGFLPDSDKISLESHPQIVGYTDSYFFSHQAHIVAMLDEYYNIQLRGAEKTELESLMNNSAVNKMQSWPAKSSVVQIDNLIIIKLGDIQNS